MEIEQYITRHTSPEDEVLSWLVRQTHLRTIHPRMLSGWVLGRFLTMVSAMVAPKRILEIGTFTGYSAICLARGLAPDGILHTVERDDELADLICQALEKAGLRERIKLHIGDAIKICPQIDEIFDLIYIDGDKREYVDYYEVAMAKLRPGGFILADNVLWGGSVLDEEFVPKDNRARGIAEFNAHIQADPRVENVLLPLRDGLMIVRKL
ncbi:MAG: O-methyltransferase [Prevotellaceae bacterium]|nr:O-methyltransferase [Prevotellaceae bacterium]